MSLKSLFMNVFACYIFASCNSSQQTETPSSFEDEDTIKGEKYEYTSNEPSQAVYNNNDSIVTRGGTTSEGFGRCSKCNCKEFEGRSQTCRNCGHSYKAHY